MSRHEITSKSGERFVYGYDRPLQQYFLDAKSDDNGEVVCLPWVGFDSPKREWSYGTRTALAEAMEHFGIWDLIPSQHQNAIALDLPIPEAGTSVTVFHNGRFLTEPAAEPEPHGSRDTFVPRHLARRSNRVPFVPKSEGPDGERFNPLQD